MKRSKLLIHIAASPWFVSVVCVLAGALLSFATIALDRHFEFKALPSSVVGDPGAATAILSTVAVSMVSLAALVLTITMVVVQLAMGSSRPGSCSGSSGTSRASSRSGSSWRPSCTRSSPCVRCPTTGTAPARCRASPS